MQLIDRIRPLASKKVRARISELRFRLRQPTSRYRVLPDFLIIGTQRGGTSSLYRYLAAHPCVMPSLRKETQYFSRRYPLGLDWYRTNFPTVATASAIRALRRNKVLTFEATPDYLFYPSSAERAAQLLPDSKLIVLLRNPIDRAYSHYNHMVRLGHENLPFETAVAAEPERVEADFRALQENPDHYSREYLRFSYIGRGIYEKQLRTWMNYFPKERFHVVRSEDFFADPLKIYREILAFLELPDWTPRYLANFSYSSGRQESYAGMDLAIHRELAERFRPHNRRLYELLKRDFHWDDSSSQQATSVI